MSHDGPRYAAIDGMVYQTGYCQEFTRPATSPLPLTDWLDGVRTLFRRQLGVEVALQYVQRGNQVVVTVSHAPIPTGKRARGTRGGHVLPLCGAQSI